MARILVEMTDDSLNREVGNPSVYQKSSCFRQRQIRWLQSLVSCDRNCSIDEFEAADAESVGTAYRSARIPFERVWMADVRKE
ncbi:hypothetical protein XM38_010610 [Halomicronema hongdechloris C2206]|uniref:Uncharacterized protein n=1 Tax=Halomicronema hongdechloris C2206 TaxID=1641165 RepID=A0A1Z3HIK8_9CYAN|nr:hypothetical protein [Halomicronema hongdechloris]ASC70131.1 hypothetical protein XM38_010610 [Halomicronema hongdechloris C2206]